MRGGDRAEALVMPERRRGGLGVGRHREIGAALAMLPERTRGSAGGATRVEKEELLRRCSMLGGENKRRDNDSLVDVLNRPIAKKTMFLVWFHANKLYPEAINLKYGELPHKFVYNEKARCWMPRKIGFSIGRVTNVPPGSGEDYYLRLLLNFQRCCTCYDDLRKVEDHVYPTFKDACFALGPLDDDNEYIASINEANEWASGDYVRRLFIVILVANNMNRPEHVWECCWKEFAKDIKYRLQQRLTNSGPPVSDDTLRNYALIEIKNILQSNSKSLSNFPPMPIPIGSMTDATVNRLVLDELDYDVDAMREELKKYLSSITDEQKKVFDDIMDAVTNDRAGLFFLYEHGVTGKTFIWKTLSVVIRSKGEIVINVVSCGIASLLLPGGRTAHSRFGLPIIVHESSTCSIKQQSSQAELLSRTKLIIWDDAPMMHMYCFEALDKTMKSIHDSDMPFGGKVVVLGGDFRKILPVVLKASRQDIVHATINSSPLWRQCKVMKLNKNMRLESSSSSANANKIREFADWIFRIGNGDAGEVIDGDATTEIPDDMLIRNSADPFLDLIEFVYPNLVTNLFTPEYFEGRVILAPTNESVGFVNGHFLSIITGEEKVISAPIARGFCNGTRLQVINMGKHVLNCRILPGKHVSDMVFIPRMTLVPSNSALPIKFQRRQFPLMVSFAMTINESQGQTLSYVGLYLPKPVFSHGQLYVALSRVKSRSGIKILINSESGDTTNVTHNVVYKEVFQRI
ncbi:PREDICTED: ATP-dependent DNA helicase PIF1-like [Erythranthe guttata]|uniref:ATP-dependent DNA helicase PIF1-like n=1 Tax=Erythranthe guttata TaxID=4155 RepID=UPI00064D8350|nr:PREDICTED: ATP-dependent DNA helicase PIF1-like [Erythranthe guttata]|eukprot:XP_012830408.1 PREDICTED: ATP-dependent DNA helicase PIF1-like [Erythranthe guttata]